MRWIPVGDQRPAVDAEGRKLPPSPASRCQAGVAIAVGLLLLGAVAARAWFGVPSVLRAGRHRELHLIALDDAADAPQFQKVTDGSCDDLGMRAIHENATCEVAARALGLVDIKVQETVLGDRPDGCYWFTSTVGALASNSHLWMSTNRSNAGAGASVDKKNGLHRHPICQGSAAADTTTTAATRTATTTAAPVAIDPSKCGVVEDNTDYPGVENIYHVEFVETAEACQSLCEEEERCGVWIWGKARMVTGLTDVCYLKAPQAGKSMAKKANENVTAGKVCKHSAAPPAPEPEYWFPPGTFFCFAVLVPRGEEQTLLALQHKERAGIFACEEAAVYSNTSWPITPGVRTIQVDADMDCARSADGNSLLNADLFVKVWAEIARGGRAKLHDWTVKVEPDTAFFPMRLRVMLQPHSAGGAVYFNNCMNGLRGSFEVMSRPAMEKLTEGLAGCRKHFNKECGGPCEWSEAMLVDQCLSQVLRAERVEALDWLADAECGAPDGWSSCREHTVTAFHPLLNYDEYFHCLLGANEYYAEHWANPEDTDS